MKKLIQICFTLCLGLSAIAREDSGEKVLQAYDWNDLMSQHPFPNSEIVTMDGMSVLKIENTNAAPLEISLLKITNSAIIKKISSLSSEIKFDKVYNRGGSSYDLDDFVPNGYKTTRDLGSQQQPLINNFLGSAGLGLSSYTPPDVIGGDGYTNESSVLFAGTSNWRRCVFYGVVPANVHLPAQLELKIYLPRTGTVYLRQIKLLAYSRSSNWWSPQLSALLGGIGGSLIGCCGGLIGCLAGLGKARRFVLAMTKTFIALGIVLTLAGIAAVVCQQPYAVWYPLLLLGGIMTLVCGVNLYPIKKRYDDLEIRRMTSMDATGH